MEWVVFEIIERTEGFERCMLRIAEEMEWVGRFKVGEFGADFDCFDGWLRTDGLNDDALSGESVEVFGEGVELINAVGALGSEVEDEKLGLAGSDASSDGFFLQIASRPFGGCRRAPEKGTEIFERRT